MANIPIITTDEREALLAAARACNEYVKASDVLGAYEAISEKERGTRPGDDFNQRGNVRELLVKHGWKMLFRKGTREFWARPGVSHISATLF